jgi:hypothetical protein
VTTIDATRGDRAPFAIDMPVIVRYPRTRDEERGSREGWPWLPGTILEQCGPDEWQVCVEDITVAVREDGSKPTPRTPPDRLYYPLCFRDSSELRPR